MIEQSLDLNNDLIVENGAFKFISDIDQVSQNIGTRLRTYQGEWFLDTTAGVDYFGEVFIKPVNIANVESIIKSEILKTENVESLISFAMEFNKTTRKLNITFTANTTYGVLEMNEELVNG